MLKIGSQSIRKMVHINSQFMFNFLIPKVTKTVKKWKYGKSTIFSQKQSCILATVTRVFYGGPCLTLFIFHCKNQELNRALGEISQPSNGSEKEVLVITWSSEYFWSYGHAFSAYNFQLSIFDTYLHFNLISSLISLTVGKHHHHSKSAIHAPSNLRNRDGIYCKL